MDQSSSIEQIAEGGMQPRRRRLPNIDVSATGFRQVLALLTRQTRQSRLSFVIEAAAAKYVAQTVITGRGGGQIYTWRCSC